MKRLSSKEKHKLFQMVISAALTVGLIACGSGQQERLTKKGTGSADKPTAPQKPGQSDHQGLALAMLNLSGVADVQQVLRFAHKADNGWAEDPCLSVTTTKHGSQKEVLRVNFDSCVSGAGVDKIVVSGTGSYNVKYLTIQNKRVPERISSRHSQMTVKMMTGRSSRSIQLSHELNAQRTADGSFDFKYSGQVARDLVRGKSQMYFINNVEGKMVLSGDSLQQANVLNLDSVTDFKWTQGVAKRDSQYLELFSGDKTELNSCGVATGAFGGYHQRGQGSSSKKVAYSSTLAALSNGSGQSLSWFLCEQESWPLYRSIYLNIEDIRRNSSNKTKPRESKPKI